MEKWLVVLGIWAMCATCAVLFIRGATGGGGKRVADEGRARAASRASAGDTRAALND
ncbi:hypothetical protein LFL96_19195 [Paraburkholderia sp. D15]|uniref:hypothetical protein n=1 Tax=Paraburkholderia sp. D15 TaxID=2880218 RepID=UPI002478ED24|nr:hypothetical protein [Paraburkholderia sp. D15]WGS49846.1 hypothetical protein LFL96_19195 [Paraburkholderia sp. D15]WKF57761.1 hypothetical protein HUO10_002255 [Paraburkholderia busanensis]